MDEISELRSIISRLYPENYTGSLVEKPPYSSRFVRTPDGRDDVYFTDLETGKEYFLEGGLEVLVEHLEGTAGLDLWPWKSRLEANFGLFMVDLSEAVDNGPENATRLRLGSGVRAV